MDHNNYYLDHSGEKVKLFDTVRKVFVLTRKLG